jgi:hypothetical protein
MTVDASRSCLGLTTCIGSVTRQIVVARVLLTATVPPALSGSSVSGGSLGPPCDAITGFWQSARCRRHAPGDGPEEACQLTGDRGSNDIGRLAAAGLRQRAHSRSCAFQAISRIGLGCSSCRSRTSRLRNV